MAKETVEYHHRELWEHNIAAEQETGPCMETCGTTRSETSGQLHGDVQVQVPLGVYAGRGNPDEVAEAAILVAEQVNRAGMRLAHMQQEMEQQGQAAPQTPEADGQHQQSPRELPPDHAVVKERLQILEGVL